MPVHTVAKARMTTIPHDMASCRTLVIHIAATKQRQQRTKEIIWKVRLKLGISQSFFNILSWILEWSEALLFVQLPSESILCVLYHESEFGHAVANGIARSPVLIGLGFLTLFQ